jgi:hypothetical protein
LGIGAIAVIATMLILTSNVSTSDVLAKKYGQSNAQSAAVNNECNAVTDIGNGELPLNVIGNTDANCIGSNVQNQDSDGAAIASNPSTSSHNDQATGEPEL